MSFIWEIKLLLLPFLSLAHLHYWDWVWQVWCLREDEKNKSSITMRMMALGSRYFWLYNGGNNEKQEIRV